ncbi:MAG TPA: hypothetical protein ENO00_00365 [Deltaproteobacteria bacterium]|nr:hypothetical protein [Deltaproteobacteria bacterium]
MNLEIMQVRVVQDAMKGWKKHINENGQPSSENGADVKSENDHVVVSVSNEKMQNNDSLFQVRKKKKSDREIFDSFFLSDHQWDDSEDD